MRTKKPYAVALVVAFVLLAVWLEQRGRTTGNAAIVEAFEQRRSKVWVEGEGEIVHLLPDDLDPPRHQRFLVQVAPGHTVKVSHNVDLASRVPVRRGDRIRFRGRFEWNEKGGVVHWTHRDPSGRRAGGWLEYDGKTYR